MDGRETGGFLPEDEAGETGGSLPEDEAGGIGSALPEDGEAKPVVPSPWTGRVREGVFILSAYLRRPPKVPLILRALGLAASRVPPLFGDEPFKTSCFPGSRWIGQAKPKRHRISLMRS
jgi:hypothetical protein